MQEKSKGPERNTCNQYLIGCIQPDIVMGKSKLYTLHIYWVHIA